MSAAVAEISQDVIEERPAGVPESARALVERMLDTPEWREMDEIDDAVLTQPQVEMPLKHIFTPGLYTRQILMRAGTLATTRIHLTEHPFIVSMGVASVWSHETGWVKISAPHLGITKPGTRRVIFAHEDTVWTTFHVTDKTDPDEIAREVTYTGGKFSELGTAAARKEIQ